MPVANMNGVDEESQLLQKTLPPRAVVQRPAPPQPLTIKSIISKVVGPAGPPTNRVSESLDYEPVQNRVFYERLKHRKEGKKKVWGYTGHTLAKFLVTFLTGIITGVIAFYMAKSNNSIIDIKLEFIQGSIDTHGNLGLFTGFLWFWFIGACLTSFGTAMVQYWAPAAAGAGVTLVMAYLNGNHIPNLLRLSTLITKFVGTVCAVSGGLPMGPEGPMVHLGACVASVITYIECGCMADSRWGNCWGQKMKSADIKEKLKILDEIVSDSDHREFVSAGVSAGISAAFGAPIGGVLFSMEEACSFWSRKTAWRCFIAAILSTFAIQLLNKSAAEHGMIGFDRQLVAMDNIEWMKQLPFILVNSAVAGLLGAIFNSVRMWLWKVRAAKTRHLLRIAEVIGLVFLVALCGFFWGWAAGECVQTPKEWIGEYGMRFNCPEGQHNDLATLFLSSSHHTIIKLFSIGHNIDATCDGTDEGQMRRRSLNAWPAAAFLGAGATHRRVAAAATGTLIDPSGLQRALLNATSEPQLQESPYTKGSLAIFCLCYLILMSIGAGLAIPGGLFMPAILLGASWGALWGLIIRDWLTTWNVQPGVYALMAATGVLGGVFRSAISLVVLVVEGTRGVNFLFGIIAAVVIANWVAHMIHHDGVYESELERIGNVYMLRDEAPHRLQTLTVEAIMATGVYGFRPIENVGRLLEVLRTTTHNGFPVWLDPNESMAASDSLDDVTDVENRPMGKPRPFSPTSQPSEQPVLILEGLILRSQLLVLLQRRHFCDATGQPIGREPNDKCELELENEMKTFFRRYYTHNRWVSATAEPLDALQLDTPGAQTPVDLSNLYLDLRPFMNRSPFVVRKDCSAARAHQVFVSLGLRHLIAVDAHNRVVGIITRKDLDHAAGHGWWRMSHVAEPPKSNLFRKMQASAIGQRITSSVSFLKGLVTGDQPPTPTGGTQSPDAWPPLSASSTTAAPGALYGAAAPAGTTTDNSGRAGGQATARGFTVRFADESSLLTPPTQSEGARLYEERQLRSQHAAAAAQHNVDGMIAANASLRD